MSRKASPEKAAARYCTYKIRYDSEETADKAIPGINARLTERKIDHSYECRFCGEWHHTSQPKGTFNGL